MQKVSELDGARLLAKHGASGLMYRLLNLQGGEDLGKGLEFATVQGHP